MKRVALFVGVNQYEDPGISPLNCAVNDARELAGLFRHKLGFQTELLTDVELGRGKSISRMVRELGRGLSAGDTFVFFFAGHGKTTTEPDDQIFLLPEVSRAALDSGVVAGEGSLSWRALRAETDRWQGVQRLFIFDACRSPLETEQASHRSGDNLARFSGEIVYRDIGLRSTQAANTAALALINSCADGERAEELAGYPGGRGLFSAAFGEVIETYLSTGKTLSTGKALGEEVAQHMRQLVRKYEKRDSQQRPFVTGGEIELLQKQAAPAPQPNLDARLWELACTVGSIEAYEKYLGDERIPCLQKDEALARIKALSTELTAREEAAEATKRAQEALVREAEARRVEEEKAAARKLAAEIKLREAAAQRAAVDRLAQERQSAEQAQTRVAPPLGQPEPNKRFKQLAIAAAVVAVSGGGVYVWSQRNTPTVVLPVVTPIAPVVAVSSPAELQAQRRAAEQLAQQQAAEKAQAEALAADQAAWNAIQNSSNAEDFKAYLQQYPQGQYLKQARARIKELSTLIAGQVLERDSLKSGGYATELVFIPASTKRFMMGTDTSHPITVRQSFALGKYEVTVGEYLACVRAGGCPEPEWREAGSKYHYQTGSDDLYRKLGSALTNDRNPIVGVSWNDASKYVNWLSAQTGQRYRLPSEAQWEYACRVGGDSTYCGGENPNLAGWYYKNSGSKAHPVGDGNKKNAWGLYDMSGNVWEWVEDGWHENYKGAPNDERVWEDGADTGRRVRRGGSWLISPENWRSGIRDGYSPSNRDVSLGFRIARTLP